MLNLSIVFFCLFSFLLISFESLSRESTVADKPALILANVYQHSSGSSIELSDYWVSEKYDGVRAYWDGKRLLSRQGYEYHAPEWFIVDFPKIALDGELWLGRGQFDRLSGIVRKKEPIDNEWQQVRYMVFDMPDQAGSFDQRLMAMRSLMINPPWLIVAKQWRVNTEAELLTQLAVLVKGNAEGLMLHKGRSGYLAKRSDDLLKLKPSFDMEGTVLGYERGKGKYLGMMGALWIEALITNARGEVIKQTFKLGSGFSDYERAHPPKIGSEITFQYSGLTSHGKPRFARYWRVRQR